MKIKGINRAIYRYILDIIIIILFVIVSYNGFMNSRLSSYASLANYYSNRNENLQMILEKDTKEELQYLNVSNAIDHGTLKITNPNNSVVSASIVLSIDKDSTMDLNRVQFEINNKYYSLNESNCKTGGNTVTVEIDSVNLEAYTTKNYDIGVILTGDAKTGDYLNYSFYVSESFYN